MERKKEQGKRNGKGKEKEKESNATLDYVDFVLRNVGSPLRPLRHLLRLSDDDPSRLCDRNERPSKTGRDAEGEGDGADLPARETEARDGGEEGGETDAEYGPDAVLVRMPAREWTVRDILAQNLSALAAFPVVRTRYSRRTREFSGVPDYASAVTQKRLAEIPSRDVYGVYYRVNPDAILREPLWVGRAVWRSSLFPDDWLINFEAGVYDAFVLGNVAPSALPAGFYARLFAIRGTSLPGGPVACYARIADSGEDNVCEYIGSRMETSTQAEILRSLKAEAREAPLFLPDGHLYRVSALSAPHHWPYDSASPRAPSADAPAFPPGTTAAAIRRGCLGVLDSIEVHLLDDRHARVVWSRPGDEEPNTRLPKLERGCVRCGSPRRRSRVTCERHGFLYDCCPMSLMFGTPYGKAVTDLRQRALSLHALAGRPPPPTLITHLPVRTAMGSDRASGRSGASAPTRSVLLTLVPPDDPELVAARKRWHSTDSSSSAIAPCPTADGETGAEISTDARADEASDGEPSDGGGRSKRKRADADSLVERESIARSESVDDSWGRIVIGKDKKAKATLAKSPRSRLAEGRKKDE